jgi:membrane-associated phospholipid phosphatase
MATGEAGERDAGARHSTSDAAASGVSDSTRSAETRNGGASAEAMATSADTFADRVADKLGRVGGPARERLADVLHQLGAVDKAVYGAVASVPSPALDRGMRRLSSAANQSKIWLAIAGALALTGPTGRRAAIRGVLAIGVSSALVNQGVKRLADRRRPDRAGAGVPQARQVKMPSSTSFPSGHSASAFAFATAISRDSPWLAIGIQFLAGGVAYSRVHTGVHYPGDTIAGALIGASTGQAVSTLVDRALADSAVKPPRS